MRLSVRVLCAVLGLACLTVFVATPPAVAQVAGQNVNMVSGTKWPTGDPFLQRQNEPSMAVSTRNPLHILAGANDYRSVDLEQVLSGGAETGDAWLGLFKSFDGGYTWQSNLLPGCPYAIGQCKDSGALSGRFQAASDPVVRAGTNGMFFYAGLAFDRATSTTTASSVSSIFVARYNDLNNNEQLDPITYIDTHIIASGNSSQFLDKPSMAVDIPRSGAGTCSFTANEPGVGANGGSLAVHQSFAAGNIYLAYTDFLQATKANSTPTHLMITHSTDCGVTWSTPIQLNTGTTTSQGSTIAVNPVTGAVYVAWRQFATTGTTPDAIMIAQSTNAGKSFSAPVQISKFQPFDQPTSTTMFRTNAYPALTSDMFGFVYVAYSARGVSSSGDARIVAAGSLDGTHWTPAIMVDNPPQGPTNPSGRGHQIMPAMTFANGRLTLLYYDLRLDHYADFYTPNPASLGNYTAALTPQGELAPPSPMPSEVFTTYIDDRGLTLRRHTLDLRVLELGIFPTVVLGPSVLVSQYEFGCCVNPEAQDIEQFKFNVPNLPLFDSGQEAFLGDYIDIVPTPAFVPSGNSWAYNFMPSVNPLFHATWTDNRDVVPPPAGGSWENYTAPVVAGAISVENGNPLPACVPGEEGMRNQNIYTSQITGGLVAAAPGNAKPLGTTTFNGKTVPFQRAFPVTAQNTTNARLNVRFTIASQPTGGTASFLQFSLLTTLDITIPPYSSVSRSVFATSTNAAASITVNVAQISAIGGSVVSNGLTSTAVLNPDITNPGITNPGITNPGITNPSITNDEVTNPGITNPGITNPSITNPGITNPDITNSSYLNPGITNPGITNTNVENVSATNPSITNPGITNPGITNPGITNPGITNADVANGSIQDVTYPMTNNGNTTASYTVKTATNSTVPGGIVLQLLINKLYQTPVAVNCVLGVQTHWVTVANITNPMIFTTSNPGITNPDITNSTPNEGTVTLAPGETAYITIRVVNPSPATISFNPLAVITPVTVPQAVNTTTVLANPNNPNLTAPAVYPPMSVLTATLPPTDQNDPGYSFQLQSSGGKPGTDTWSLISSSVQGISISSSGLLTATGLPLGPNSITVQVADSATPPNTALKSFSIPVNNAFMPNVPSRFNDGVVGQSYVGSSFTTTGGTLPIMWTATGLPTGLSLSSTTGQFTQVVGVPTGANPTGSAVQLTATDSASPPVVLSASVTIRVGGVIQITPATLPSGTIGVAYSANLSASGGIPGTSGSYVFSLAAPATGVSLDSSGAVTIANPQSPTISFSVSVHDQSNSGSIPGYQVANANYTINFAGPPSANVLFVTEPPNYVGGQTSPNSPVHIHVQDNQGAALPGVQVTMSFNGTPPCASATLSGTLTQTTSQTGDIFYTDLSVDHGQVGYTLKAAAATVSGVSTPFNVSGFCETGNMITARRNHMVIALPNGKILLTGGAGNADGDAASALASAELYDPVAHTFSSTGNAMSAPRVDHTVTLLLTGEVLVTGGYSAASNGNGQSSADLYFPANNVFNPVTAPMTHARAEHAATLLANGKVLITGGNDDTGLTVATAEIYDPILNTFTATSHPMNSARQAHHADLLPNGKVLISGGLDGSNNALASAEIYDPVADTFTPTGSMTTARGNHSSALLYTGQILVAGGLTGPGNGLVVTATAELYNPATGTFTPTVNMSIPRGHYAGILLGDGTDFISGGATLPAGINADIYNPATQTFSVSGNFTAAQAGVREAVAPDGTVLLASGVNNAVPAITVPNSELFYPAPLPTGIVITTPTTLPAAALNASYTQVFLEHGGVGQVTWVGDTLPPGLTLTANGMLTGTPTQTGTFNFFVSANDTSASPQSTTVQFTLQVSSPGLAITTASLPNGLVGAAYNNPIVTTGGTQPVFFSLTTASFPPGLTITQPAQGSQTGALAGTPTTPGTYNFSETVTDSSIPPQTATVAYTVQVNGPLTITPATLPDAVTVNGFPGTAPPTSYSAQIPTAGGTGGALTFSVTAGALPTSITLNTATGALTSSSVTAAAGTYNFTIGAVSAGPPSSAATPQAFTLTVVVLIGGGTPNTLPAGTAGVAYSQSLNSVGGTPPITYHYTLGNLPPGLAITTPGANGLLSGTPTSAGSFAFEFSATDSSTPAQTYLESVTVSIAPQPATINGSGTNAGNQPQIFWAAGTTGNVSGYNVYRSTQSGGPYSLAGSTSAAATTFADPNAPSGNTYYYVVRAVAGGVESVNSNEVSVTLP